jgi:transketolase
LKVEVFRVTAKVPIYELEAIARQTRREIIRTIAHAKGGHIGGPLSAVEILTALYFRVMRVRTSEPEWVDRDRFILSKGHSSVALYVTLALRGYFPIEELITFDAVDSRLQGHPDMSALPCLDMSTGSLGLGFSAGVGIALGAKLAGREFTTFVLVGDGECNEGSIWEGAHVANRFRLENLIVVVDQNQLQQFCWRDGQSGERVALPPYADHELAGRWAAFGWRVLEVDGHDLAAVIDVLEEARQMLGAPTVVIAHTVKGKGVSFMENNYLWHSRVPTAEEMNHALDELADPITTKGVR